MSATEQIAKSLLRRVSGEIDATVLPPGIERDLEPPPSPEADAPAPAGPRLERPAPPLRLAPSLQVPQHVIVGFLTGGYGFDDASVSEALAKANGHFAKRELQQALDTYGAAYELGRLNYDYRPLMHDLVLRRVLCLSMMGQFREGLRECQLALKIIPNAATASMLRGLLYSKLGDSDAANDAFQQAVTQNGELRDVIDCVIALFTYGHGDNDRAIDICNTVLDRGRHPFALLLRGDAYKFHPSGFFLPKATKDYSELLEQDIGVQALVGEKFNKELHARADELVLRFHPRLLAESPRPYSKYPLFGKTQPFLVVALVLFAIGKLRAWVRSTKLVRDVEMKNEELLRQRAEAEHRMLKLFEAQEKLAGGEAHSEVWGPANPDLRVRRYRRYWMERPLDFPRRGDSPGPRGGTPGRSPRAAGAPEATLQPSDVKGTSPWGARDELFDRIDVDRDGVISREEFNRFVLEAKAPVPIVTNIPPPPQRSAVVQAAAELARHAAELPSPWLAGGLSARLKAAKDAEEQRLQGTEAPATAKAEDPRPQAAGASASAKAEPPSPARETPRKPPGAATPSTTAGCATRAASPDSPDSASLGDSSEESGSAEADAVAAPAHLAPASKDKGTAGTVDLMIKTRRRVSAQAGGPVVAPAASGKQASAATEALEAAAKLAQGPAPSVVAATKPKLKTGHNWTEEQWIERAVQLADKFRCAGDDASGALASKGDAGRFKRPSPKPMPVPEPLVPPPSVIVELPVAGPPGTTTSNLSRCGTMPRRDSVETHPGLDASPGQGNAAQWGGTGHTGVDDDACMPDDERGFVGVHRPGLQPGTKVPMNLVEALETYGFDVVPEWYSAVDRIYEITDMAPFSVEPEPVVPVPGLAGAPGFSYVVPPKSPVPAERGLVAPSFGAARPPSEAMTKRYHSRLVATKQPGAPRGASQPGAGCRGPPNHGAFATNKVGPVPRTAASIDLEDSSWEPPRYQQQAEA